MKRAALVVLLAGCFDFEAAQQEYCRKNPAQCADAGAGGGAAGGSAGGAAGGSAGGAAGGGTAGGQGGGAGGATGGGAGGGMTDAGSPINLTRPSISGFPQEGQRIVADAGTWSGAGRLDYRWLVELADGGQRVTGATGITYAPVAADVGGNLVFEVTATNASASAFELTDPLGPLRPRPHPLFVTGFEHGQPLRGESTGQLTHSMVGTADVFAMPRHGRFALRTAAVQSADSFWRLSVPIFPVIVLRFGLYIDTMTSFSAGDVMTVTQAGERVRLQFVNQALQVQMGSSTSGTVSFPIGTWGYVDLRIDGRSNPWVVDWSVNGAPAPRLLLPLPPGSFSDVRLGRETGPTSEQLTAYFDDFAWSNSWAEYPMGDGRVEALPLVKNGASISPAIFTCRDVGSNGPCDGGSFAAQLNDWPNVAAATWVEQSDAGINAYLEYEVADAGVWPAPAPNAVRYLMEAEGNAGWLVPGFEKTGPFTMPTAPQGFAWFSTTQSTTRDGGTWQVGDLAAHPVRLGYLPAASLTHVHSVLVEVDISK